MQIASRKSVSIAGFRPSITRWLRFHLSSQAAVITVGASLEALWRLFKLVEVPRTLARFRYGCWRFAARSLQTLRTGLTRGAAKIPEIGARLPSQLQLEIVESNLANAFRM